MLYITTVINYTRRKPRSKPWREGKYAALTAVKGLRAWRADNSLCQQCGQPRPCSDCGRKTEDYRCRKVKAEK